VPDNSELDAVVVGSGPNGLAAAVALASTGRSVLVVEGADRPGGGMRSEELTLPGYVHDVCSAVHPLALASPYLRTLPLEQHGLRWVHPPLELAHPLDDGSAGALDRSLDATADGLGGDGRAWRRLYGPLVRDADAVFDLVLGPLRVPRRPLPALRFGLRGPWPVTALARRLFDGEAAKALVAGMAGHTMLPLSRAPSGGLAVLMGTLAHAVGWPVVRGGSERLADALVSHLRSLGGRIECGRWVSSIDELPRARAYLFDVTPRQLVGICGDRLPRRYTDRLAGFRYGPGVCKVDWALNAPVPWKAAECTRAATVHVGGTLQEIAASEADVWAGRHPERPFVIVAQQSLFDATRAPAGRHVLWGYCHVPSGSTVDHSEAIEAQIERFAPGFRDTVVARHVRTAAGLEAYNPNAVGGDINGGVQDLFQHFTRPVPRLDPYGTPDPSIFICSSSTPPGGGVHGMSGYYAARSALRRALG
jgi:phytoene dehydrogenase-like protein